jgi:hypothetical protein
MTGSKPRFPKRVDEWCRDAGQRTADGRRIWRCWNCASLEPWSDRHGWFGSYLEWEAGHPFPVWCSTRCRDALIARRVLPPMLEGEEIVE